jgi:hypothetical protein
MNIIRKIKHKLFLNDLKLVLKNIPSNDKITTALSKGALSASVRIIDETNPISWEFSSFSQNGEDGIIDYLSKRILNPNKYFIEVGASNGIECNSAYLAFVQKFSGLMIDGNDEAIEMSKSVNHNMGVEYYSTFLNLQNLHKIKEWTLFNNPDLFSLDTDGNDYYFVKGILDLEIKPKIFVVEYNSAFGPDNEITIKYDDSFYYLNAHSTGLYYGCSIALWKKLFTYNNYSFISVDSNGVNAFFVDNTAFDEKFIRNLKGRPFEENFYQQKKYRSNWEKQFDLIKNMSYFIE